MGFPDVSAIKNLPAKQETLVGSLGRENSLEKEMATLSSVLALEIPWTEEPGRLPAHGSQRVRNDLATKPPLYIYIYIYIYMYTYVCIYIYVYIYTYLCINMGFIIYGIPWWLRW